MEVHKRNQCKAVMAFIRGGVCSLCYLFCRCTRSVSVCPPAYYAHLAAFRGRAMLQFSDSSASESSGTDKSVAVRPYLLIRCKWSCCPFIPVKHRDCLILLRVRGLQWVRLAPVALGELCQLPAALAAADARGSLQALLPPELGDTPNTGYS